MEEEVRVQLKIEGGLAYFPGLSKPRVIDSAKLSTEDRVELERLVSVVHFFEQPAQVGRPAKGAADYRQYIVTIAEEKRSHTVRLVEPIQDASLQALLEFIQSKA